MTEYDGVQPLEDVEAPEADTAEQHLEVTGEQAPPPRTELPFDADEGDATEQDRIVEMDEDDYR